MRFRGMIHDVASMNQLHRVLWTLAKMVKSSAEVYVFRLTPDFIYFVKEESAAQGGITLWARLAVPSLFDDYHFEGLSRRDNEIQLEIVPAALVPAFKTALAGSTSAASHHATGGSHASRSLTGSFNAKSLKMKLTKKPAVGPCLCIEVELPPASAHIHAQSRVLTHEVGVHVIPKRNWVSDEDCQNPRYDLSLWLPPLRTLKNVADKMKNMSSHVILLAEKVAGYHRQACLKLNAENEFVSITTTFNELRMPDLDPDDDDEGGAGDGGSVAVRIDVKKLVAFLSSLQFPIDTICASFQDGEAAHLSIAESDFLFQYRLPAVNL